MISDYYNVRPEIVFETPDYVLCLMRYTTTTSMYHLFDRALRGRPLHGVMGNIKDVRSSKVTHMDVVRAQHPGVTDRIIIAFDDGYVLHLETYTNDGVPWPKCSRDDYKCEVIRPMSQLSAFRLRKLPLTVRGLLPILDMSAHNMLIPYKRCMIIYRARFASMWLSRHLLIDVARMVVTTYYELVLVDQELYCDYI